MDNVAPVTGLAQEPPFAPTFPIVGIGASAGGLDAFRHLLRFLPVDTGMAYVFVQHLDPTHESLLTALIARATPMEVCEVRMAMVVEPNHVYVIAPNTDLLLDQGRLTLRPETKTRGQHLSIDTFLHSLAENRAAQAIGVLLSGMAADGTAGMEAIKAQGGITMAQDARSAPYAMMPQNAIAAGCVDFIGSPEQLARELTRISRSPSVHTPDEQAEEEVGAHPGEPVLPEEEQAFAQILRLLRQKMGVDMTAYKPTMLKRRIQRRMAGQQMESFAQYLSALRDQQVEVEALYQDILIGVTSFFRNPSTYSRLTHEVFGSLLEPKSPRDPLRLWVPGCSTGEEVYSLAICLLEFLAEHADTRPIQLFGTDLNPRAIEQARAGLYSPASVEGLSRARLDRFFQPVKGQFQITKSLRECCIFSRHDLLRDPPFSRLDLLSCQNVLIYLQPDVQQKLLQIFHYALLPQGVLLLGASETIRGAADLFTQLGTRKQPLYRKKATRTRPSFIGPVSRLSGASSRAAREESAMPQEENLRESTLQKEADYVLLDRYAPASLVIDAEQEICHFRGPIGSYLEPMSGKASLNLFKMVREGLRLELHIALRQARTSGYAVKKTGIQLHDQHLTREIAVEVIPLKDLAFLILFTETLIPPETPSAPTSTEEHTEEQGERDARERRIQQLKQELIAKRVEMHTIVEEMEATNEELQSANEEILSSNEELQSLNEELETSKEEIQASNEELLVVNQELSARNADLLAARVYAEAIVETIREPLLVLDAQMYVQRANKAFYRVFRTTVQDTEQQHLFTLGNGQWNIPMLRRLLEKVLPSKHQLTDYEVEHTFPTIGHKIFLLNACHIEGATLMLLALEDITERKQAEQERERLLAHREEFMAMASHELKTPVTSLKGYTQLLQSRFQKAGDERSAALLTKMDGRLDKLIHLIRELLDVTHLEAGQLPWHTEHFDLEALVREIVEDMGHTTEQHQICIEGALSTPISGDRERVGQVLINLLSNAIKYSPHADAIRVGITSDAENATISVQDFGIGIASEKLAHVFERFFRVSDPEHATYPGLGLGLFISAQIIKRAGGRMWVESQPNLGSTFFFTVPLAREREPDPASQEGAKHHVQNDPRRG